MAWLLLVIAGLIEAGWAIGLKYTDGFTKLVPSVLTIAGIAASMVLLSLAARTLPIGTAYAVWVGIGAAGAVVLGILFLGEPVSLLRMAFLALLLGRNHRPQADGELTGSSAGPPLDAAGDVTEGSWQSETNRFLRQCGRYARLNESGLPLIALIFIKTIGGLLIM